MAGYSRASFLLFLVTSGIFQMSYCSRTSPGELQRPPVPSRAVHGADELPRHAAIHDVRPTEEATGHRGANADGGAPAVKSADPLKLDDGGVGSEQRMGESLVQQVLRSTMLHFRLARRILEGDADSAAGPSCHSNSVHVTCTPPAKD